MAEVLFPLAISSQLDVTGEERVHAAKYNPTTRNTFVPPVHLRLALGPAASPYLPTALVESSTNTFTSQAITNPDTTNTYSTDPNGLALSPDGTHLAVVGYTGLVHDDTTLGVSLFKYASGSYTQLTPILWDRAVRVCFSPDGDHLAVGGSLSSQTANFIRVYKRAGDTYSLIFSETMTGSENVWDIEYTPDGTHMILGTNAPFYEGDHGLSLYVRIGDTYTKVSQASNPFPSIGGNTCYYVTAKADKVFASANGNTTKVYTRAGNAYTLTQTIAIGGSFIEPAVTDDGTTLILNNTVYTFNGSTYVSSGAVTGTSGTKAIAKFDKDDRLFLGTQTALYLLERSGSNFVVTSTTGLPATWINALGLYPGTN